MECRSGEEVLMPARGTSALAYGILCHQEINMARCSGTCDYPGPKRKEIRPTCASDFFCSLLDNGVAARGDPGTCAHSPRSGECARHWRVATGPLIRDGSRELAEKHMVELVRQYSLLYQCTASSLLYHRCYRLL